MSRVVRQVGCTPEQLFDIHLQQGESTGFGGSMAWTGPILAPDGQPAVGALGVLVDEVLGYPLVASLPTGWTVSTEIWIDLVAPLPAPGGRMEVTADVVQRGSFAVGEVRHDRTGLVALVRERGRQVVEGPFPGASAVPVAGDDRPGVATTASRLLGDALGARLQSGDRLVVAPSPGLANPGGVLHGGLSLAASELAATAYRDLAGSSLRTTSLHIVHLRAASVGVPLELHVETVHAGRTLWLSEVRGYTDGRLCTVARISAE